MKILKNLSIIVLLGFSGVFVNFVLSGDINQVCQSRWDFS